MAWYEIVRISDSARVHLYEASSVQEYGGPWGDTDLYTHSVVDDAADSEFTQKAWDQLRGQRNGLLLAFDYTQLPDAPLTASGVADWATYRQELRDLPANTSEPRTPTWPTQPA
jgi:hypothetical protein